MYNINNGEYKVSTIEDVYDFLIKNADNWMDEDEFELFLDDNYDDIHIDLFGSSYAPSEAYKKIDNVAYDMAKDKYIESIVEDFVYNLKYTDDINVRDIYQINKI